MLKRNLVLKLGTLMIAVSALAATFTLIYAHKKDDDTTVAPIVLANAAQIARPAAGMGSIVWTNYMGKGDELFVDLAGTQYAVPEETNGIPVRGQISLAPGTYNFTASVPNVGSVTRSIDVAAGHVIGLSFFLGSPNLVNNNHSLQTGDVGQHSYITFSDYDQLLMVQGDLTNQAR